MNIKYPTVNNLVSQVAGVCVTADITENELLESIMNNLDALRRVDTPEAKALVQLAGRARNQARAQLSESVRRAEMATLAVWLGTIRVGWL